MALEHCPICCSALAHALKDITLLKFGLSLITILAVLALLYFGWKGIIKKDTIWLLRPFGGMRMV